jgi:hypothetical protein
METIMKIKIAPNRIITMYRDGSADGFNAGEGIIENQAVLLLDIEDHVRFRLRKQMENHDCTEHVSITTRGSWG